uniref:Uncharacterized protein n=1 Tax=Salix viminalis TaxID=40686 RepID=A0A6N2MNB8_SALVM
MHCFAIRFDNFVIILIIAVWNWKDHSIRYQYAGNSGPALVLAHGLEQTELLEAWIQPRSLSSYSWLQKSQGIAIHSLFAAQDTSSPVVAWKLPSIINLLQPQIHLLQRLPAPTYCGKLPPAADSLLLFPLGFCCCCSFSWLVLIKAINDENSRRER